MDLNDYYRQVYTGNKVDNTEVLNYIKSFRHVVLWGASYLGNSIGKYLVEQGIEISGYWDMRAAELGEVNGIKVNIPFQNSENHEQTLVILCIGNTAIFANLIAHLNENGYENILRGDKLFMGTVCKYTSETGIDGTVCNGSMTCRSMFCEKLHNIVHKRNDKGGLFLPNITFMITTHCSLKCKYCVAYMNSYEANKREFFSYEQIEQDIDKIFDTVDAIGSITIQGGEPFLHPDIDKIIKKVLEKKNIGIVSVATNGIFRITDEKLEGFQDTRLNVAFSGYYDALPKDTLDIYYNNIEQMKRCNVPHTVGVRMPEWAIPPTLWNRNYSKEVMMGKKAGCKLPERCMQVVNGKLYPCLYSASLHGIGIADYKTDYIELKQNNFSEELQKFMEQPFYYSCGHCGGGGGTTNMAGEQGYYDFITPQEEREI